MKTDTFRVIWVEKKSSLLFGDEMVLMVAKKGMHTNEELHISLRTQ